jgi:hypothetical protein
MAAVAAAATVMYRQLKPAAAYAVRRLGPALGRGAMRWGAAAAVPGAGEIVLIAGIAYEVWGIYNEMSGEGGEAVEAAQEAAAGANSASLPPNDGDKDPNTNDRKPKQVERLHSKETILKDNPDSYKYWSNRPTREIVDSLRPSYAQDAEPLMVNRDGKIVQGNTRILVLEERGFDIQSLPRMRY